MNLPDASFSNSQSFAASKMAGYRNWRRENPNAPFADYVRTELPNCTPIDNNTLIEIATIDLIYQINEGRNARAESYIDSTSLIATNSDYVLDLIDAELCARTDWGETVCAEELTTRFPKLSTDVVRLFAIHQIDLESAQSDLPRTRKIREIGPYLLGTSIFRDSNREIHNAVHSKSETRATVVLHDLKNLVLSDQTIDDLKQHFKIIERTSHPQLPKILGFGVTNSHAYMAFEIANGSLLSDQLDSDVDSKEAARWLLTIAISIQAAMEAGACFSGIEPHDIFVDHLNHPRLMSFGLADQLDFLRSGNIEIRKDSNEPAVLSSLGFLLFAVLLNTTEIEDLKNHLKFGHDPISIIKVDPTVSANLDAIYQCCISVHPKNSYGTLEQLIEDLECFLSDKPIVATKLIKKRRWGRR